MKSYDVAEKWGEIALTVWTDHTVSERSEGAKLVSADAGVSETLRGAVEPNTGRTDSEVCRTLSRYRVLYVFVDAQVH